MAQVKEITTISEMEALFPLMKQMYPELTLEEYQSVLPERVAQGYRKIVVFNDAGIAQALAGFWISYRFYCKKFLQIDNMIADKDRTVKGCGKMLLDWVYEEAKRHQCARVLLDTCVENFDVHRLFLREGFWIRAHHCSRFVA